MMGGILRRTVLGCCVGVLIAASAQSGMGQVAPLTATYEVSAIRFGVIPQFRVSGLIAGADASRRLDIPVMVWLLKGHGRNVLEKLSRSVLRVGDVLLVQGRIRSINRLADEDAESAE